MTDVQDQNITRKPSQDEMLAKIRSEIDRLVRQQPGDGAARAAGHPVIPAGNMQPPGFVNVTPHHLLRVPAAPELPPLEIKPQYELGELLQYEDEAFVHEMYRAILQRAPDAAGCDYYLGVLRSGTRDKIDAIAELRQSDEARAVNTQIVGLEAKLRRRRWSKAPVVGRLLSIAASLADLPRISKAVQLQNARLAQHRRETARAINALAANIEGVMARQSGEIFGQLRAQVRFIHRHKASVRPVAQLAEDVAHLQQVMDTTYTDLAAQWRSLAEDLDAPSFRRRLDELGAATQTLGVQARRLEESIRSPLAALVKSLAEVREPPPLFGLKGLHPAASDPDSKARAIAKAIEPFGRRYHLVHFGCAAGFDTFYLAQRGAVAVGYDENPRHIQLAEALRGVNGIPVEFAIKPLDLETARQIPHGAFDVCLVLSALRHVMAARGVEVGRQILAELADRVPVLIIEEPGGDFAGLDLGQVGPAKRVEKIGDFAAEEGSGTRGLYLLTQDAITVNNTTYPIRARSFVAYPQAPAMARQFIWSDNVFIKKYLAASDSAQPGQLHFNVPQILREIVNYQLLPAETTALPRLIDCELRADTISIVFERIYGANLMDLLTAGKRVEPRTLLKPLLMALRQLRQVGLYHNDLRPWNVLVNDETVWLIDLGLATPAEHESTIAGLLWILFDAGRGSPSEKYPMPLLEPPSTNAADYHASVRDVVQQLLDAGQIDTFFERVAIDAL